MSSVVIGVHVLATLMKRTDTGLELATSLVRCDTGSFGR
jgi:hypothetical protein